MMLDETTGDISAINPEERVRLIYSFQCDTILEKQKKSQNKCFVFPQILNISCKIVRAYLHRKLK